MKGVLLLVLAGVVLSSMTIHIHPTTVKLQQYGGVFQDEPSGPNLLSIGEIALGMLYGVGISTSSVNITACIKDPVEIADELRTAIIDIKKLSWEGVEEGIEKLGTVLQFIPTAMSICLSEATQDELLLKELLEKFERPTSFFFQVETHLMVDRADILSDMKAAVVDWDNSDWYHFGVDVGSALSLLINGHNVKLNPKHTLEVVAGLLVGIAANLGLAEIQDCIQDVGILGSGIHRAYEELLQATLGSVKAGLSDLGDALEQLPAAIQTCDAADTANIAKIEAALSSFKNPVSFVFHMGNDLIVNGKQIFIEVDQAMLAYHSKNYEAFGNAMGQALAAVIVGQSTTPYVNVLDVVAGVLEGVGDNIIINSIANCINATETVGANLAMAVALLKNSTDAAIAKQAIHDFGTALEFLPGAITSCRPAYMNDAAVLQQMIKNFENPKTFNFELGLHLAINSNEIYSNMVTASADWDEENWFGFGENLGEAMAKTIVSTN